MDQTAQPIIPPPVNTPPIPTQAIVSQQPVQNSGDVRAVGEAVQAGAAIPPPPYTQGYSGAQSVSVPKEHMAAPPVPERVPLVELQEPEKIPEEVEGWMEKLEQAGEIKIPEAIKKDEQIILDNATPTRVKDTVVLPLTQQGAVVAAKQSVSDSARWLYEWCKRLMKMLQDRAKYRV